MTEKKAFTDAMIARLTKPAYTVGDVAVLTGFSRRTITRMFEREKGVLTLTRPATMHKRRYRSLRIPQAVYARVILKWQGYEL